MADSQTTLENPYRLISVQCVGVPAGADGPNWHQYVIRQGENEIRGFRQGTALAVTAVAEQMVTDLNERRSHKPGRRQIVLRGRKPRQQ
jgi:hypothetical protein